MKVKDLYDEDTFKQVLDDAETNAKTDRAIDFVNDMRTKFEKWGMAMYLSDSQDEWLHNLAEE